MSADDDKAWQEVIDEAVARGLLIPIELNSEGKMVYRRTQEKLNDAWFGSRTLAKKIPRPS
jgi:hypothetical protein